MACHIQRYDTFFLKKKVIQGNKNKLLLVLNASLSFVSGAVRCSSALSLFIEGSL